MPDPVMKAMKAGAIGLRNGKVLNIYPEGERAYDGELHDFKKGAAILATELDMPILPVALDGLQNVWARKSWRIRPAKVKIRFGKAFYAKDILSQNSAAALPANAMTAAGTSAELTDDARYEMVTKHLKETIEKMISEMRS